MHKQLKYYKKKVINIETVRPVKFVGKCKGKKIGPIAGPDRRSSSLTISEGLKGFPCPLIPPEMLKPRPGFFSIRTQNCQRTQQRDNDLVP